MKNISRPPSIRLRFLAIPLLTSLCLAAQAQEPIPAKRCPRPQAPTLEAGVPYPPGKSTLTVRLTVGEAGDLRQLSIEGPDIFRPPIEKVFADYRCAAGDAALELSQTFVFNIASSDRGPAGNVNSLCKHMSVIDPNDLPAHLPDGRYLVRARFSFEPDGRLNVAELKGQPALYPAVTRALQRYRCASSALIEQEFEIRIES